MQVLSKPLRSKWTAQESRTQHSGRSGSERARSRDFVLGMVRGLFSKTTKNRSTQSVMLQVCWYDFEEEKKINPRSRINYNDKTL